jgi:ComF family protein
MIGKWGRDLVHGIVEMLFPSICWVCEKRLAEEEESFCHTCKLALLQDGDRTCPRCASSVGEFAEIAQGCPECMSQRFAFDGAIRLGRYEGILRDAILKMKSATGEGLAESLGSLYAEQFQEQIRQIQAQLIVPIPLHWRKRWQRGYNQCESLGEGIARKMRISLDTRVLRRVRSTAPQSELSPTARQMNVKDAFAIGRKIDLKGKTILLVDDVLTTGSTVNEAAKKLKDAGASRVVVLVASRANSPG